MITDKMQCAKQVVSCMITSPEGFVVYGENYCLNPQPVCPRLPGEGYEKCHTICKQVGHAEEVAIMKAIEKGFDLSRARATISHKRICDNCAGILEMHNITDVVLIGAVDE